MNKRVFLFFTLVVMFFLKVSSQTFTYRTSLKEMCGDPGDIFACTVSFTNTSNAPINIHVDRYQKTMPAYWYSCYCYLQCNSPLRDTITINIPAFSTDMMVVQFKTDSVNPGISTSDFKIYQIGFQNNLDSFGLTANTGCIAAGLNQFKDSRYNYKLFPTVNNGSFTLVFENNIEEKIVEVIDIMGKVAHTQKTNSEKVELKLELNPGTYFVKATGKNLSGLKKIIVE